VSNGAIDLKSLPLHDLLSAPLSAAIEAGQQASLGLVSFIQDIGFEAEGDGPARVRMVEFRYVREGLDADGNPAKFENRLRIPLLAMVSLPRLEIERLDINIQIGLQSAEVAKGSPRLGISRDLEERYPFLRGHTRLKVAPSPRRATRGSVRNTRPYDLEISLTASSDEANDGVDRVLTLLTGLISEESR